MPPSTPPFDTASAARKVRAGFAAAVTALLILAFVSYHAAQRLIETVHWVIHTHEVLHQLEAVDGAADDSQSDARGYVVTGEERFRSSSRAAARRMEAGVAGLRGMISDNPRQLGRLDEVRRLSARRAALSARTVDLRRAGALKAAAALIASDAPRRASDELEGAIRTMTDEEHRLLSERTAKADADARLVVLTAAFSRCVGAVVVLLAFLAVRRYLDERAGAESKLTEARDAALRDAEDRRKSQEEIRRLSERLRAVLDQTDSGVLVIEANGTVSLFNREAERIYGAWRNEVESVMRAGTHPLLQPDGKTPLAPEADPIARALRGETVRDASVFLRVPSRPLGCLLRASAAPMRSPEGIVTGAALVFRESAGRAGPGAVSK